MLLSFRSPWFTPVLAFLVGLGGSALFSSGPGKKTEDDANQAENAGPAAAVDSRNGTGLFAPELPLLELATALESKLAGKGSEREFREAWHLAAKMRNEVDGQLLQELIMRWWTRISPEAALEFAEEIAEEPSRWSAIKAVFKEWGMFQPAAAIAAAREPVGKAPGEEERVLMIIQGVSRSGDVTQAIELAGRHSVIPDIATLRSWAALMPQDTWECMKTLDMLEHRLEMEAFAGAIPRDQLSPLLNALAEGSELDSPAVREALGSRLVQRFAEQDPSATMKLIAADTRFLETTGLVSSTLERWLEKEPEAATSWLRGLAEDDPLRQAAAPGMVRAGLITNRENLEVLFQSVYRSEIETLTAAVLGLPQNDLTAQLEWIESWRAAVFEADYQRALGEALFEFAPQEETAESLRNLLEITFSRGHAQAAQVRLRNFAYRFPRAAAEWLDEQYQGRPPGEMVADVAVRWARTEPVQSVKWIAGHPWAPARERAWKEVRDSLPARAVENLSVHLDAGLLPTLPPPAPNTEP